MKTMNPVQIEIIRNALVSSAEEMSVTIWRTSRSSVVREILDYSTCVFDANGQSVAQAARMPVHLNSMASCLEDLIDHHIPIEDWHEGDVVITNDPYSGGQHLPDILTFRPVFVDSQRIAIAGILVHHLDVGGGAAGSYYAEATEIFQEGLCIPPLKIVEGGKRNEAVVKMLLANSRQPENVGGDFASQLAALETGARSLEKIGQRYGADQLADACQRIQAGSEAQTRAIFAEIPNGTWEFEDFVDDDGIETDRCLRIHARLTVQDDSIEIDLSGSSDQAKGPVNCTLNMTRSAVICGALMSIGREVPANAGCYRPISVVAPPGSVVNANHPAPVANRMAVGHRVVNAVMGAFAQAVPERVPASYYGVSYAYALNVFNADGSRQIYFDLECGGWGGHPEGDGASGFSCGFHNISNTPVEMIENDVPVTFLRYGLIPDSGGAGKFRGGLGLVREFRLDAPAGNFAANLDRFKVAPYGLQGGEPGRTGSLILLRAGSDAEKLLASKVADLSMSAGDIVRIETSGGGGHGEPDLRDEAAILNDREQGYTT
ncbi:MAG: hydantoinase B/oxoprolinase family protein [Alphaproteobacteria bacterium]|nr:hydantoinase B/oxoprolinase family protein [Alphaproteobacteria bacterium]MBT7745022.1 hydantoinase B/oxoprolinase family protein [Alphaproteobacteria bacterium]